MAAWLDVCRFVPTAGGTTDWSYSSAVTGYQSPVLSGVTNARVYKYRAESADLSQWEVGEGVYNTGSNILTRVTVLYNSSGTGTAAGQSGAGTKINFSTVPQVAVVALKEDLISIEEANAFTALQKNQAMKNIGVPAMFIGFINGLTLSTPGASITITAAAGIVVDSTGTDFMQLSGSLNKQVGAWAVGNNGGGLDTGSTTNSTWYHLYVIKRIDTQVVDLIYSLSASAPTLPANYTIYRRIGSIRTDGSGNWTKFIQDGDLFEWDIPVQDVNATNPGTAAVLRTLTTPLGINVQAIVSGRVTLGTSSNAAVILSDPNITDTSPSNYNGIAQWTGNTTLFPVGNVVIRTNTSSQIRIRQDNSGASDVLNVYTRGWYDTRGK